MTNAKELAAAITCNVIATVNNQNIPGGEKHKKVFEYLSKIDNGVPYLGWIPDELEAEAMDFGWDEIVAELKKVDLHAYIEKHFQRIKHLFKK